MMRYLIVALVYLFNLHPLQAEDRIKACIPSSPPDCGVRVNKNLEEDKSIKGSKYFYYKYPKDVEQEYKLSASWQVPSAASIQTTVSTTLAYNKKTETLHITSKAVKATDAEGKELKISDKKDSTCKYNFRGDALTEGCYFAPTSIYALPKVELKPGQSTTDRISVPYSLQDNNYILDIERDFTLVDYIKLGQQTLARLQVKEKLLSAGSTDINNECPKIYYTSSRLIYVDIKSMLPYNILSLTKLGIKDQLDTEIIIKLEEDAKP